MGRLVEQKASGIPRDPVINLAYSHRLTLISQAILSSLGSRFRPVLGIPIMATPHLATTPPVQLPNPTQSQWIRGWRLALPLAAQVLILLTIPAQKAMTFATGTTVFLETRPVDPYDVLRGRYVTLNYAITNDAVLQDLPGWEEFAYSSEFYLALAPSDSDPQAPWVGVAMTGSHPDDLDPGHVAIRVSGRGWQRDIGLSEYYIPDAIGDALEADMADHPARVEAKVDQQGNAALVRLWVQDRQY